MTVSGLDVERLTPEAAARVRARGRLTGHWVIRALNNTLFPEESVGKCGAPLGAEIVAGCRTSDGRAGVRGIATCGSSKGCARCGAVIRSVKGEEIQYFSAAHLDRGRCLLFLTLTVPHEHGEDLEPLLEGLQRAWSKTIAGRPWMGFKRQYGVLGQIKVVEVTLGRNGWHPHLHVLLFVDRPPLDPEGDDVRAMEAWLASKWHVMVDRWIGGRRTLPGVGAKLLVVNGGVGAKETTLATYLAKISWEMTRADLKVDEAERWSSRTPWQVGIDAYLYGDTKDIAAWCEWVRASKGTRIYDRSPSLADHYGTPATEAKTDEELAAQADDLTEQVAIDARVWGVARTTRLAGGRSAVADALLALEDGDIEDMRRTLAQLLGRRVVRVDRGDRVPLLAFAGHEPPMDDGSSAVDRAGRGQLHTERISA